jgi:hypothetical protein
MTTLAQPNPDEFKPSFAEPVLNKEVRDLLDQVNFTSFVGDEAPVFDAKQEVVRKLDFRGWDRVPGKLDEHYYSDIEVPESCIKAVGEINGRIVHACYEKVLDPIASDDLATIAKAAYDRPFHYVVSYRYHDWEFCDCSTAKMEPVLGQGFGQLYHHACGRWGKPKVVGNFGDHVASLHMGMPDDEYNGYYPTLPGNDVAHFNPNASGMDCHRGGETMYGNTRLDNQNRVIEKAQEIRGGSEIKGGRAEWKEKTKGLIAWDGGTQKHLDRLKKEASAERKAKNRIRIETALNKGPVKPFEV